MFSNAIAATSQTLRDGAVRQQEARYIAYTEWLNWCHTAPRYDGQALPIVRRA